MRATMLGYVLTFLTIINITLVCCLFSRSIYKDEVQNSLDNSIEMSMTLLQRTANNVSNDDRTISNDSLMFEDESADISQLESDFINILTNNINSKITNLEVNFYQSDETTNILSVEVFAEFKYLDGSTGTVSSYKTMVIDKVKK